MTLDVAVKVLAVIGGAVVGGLGLGLLTQLLLRAVTVRKQPRWSALIVRLLGGTICGWVVALWLFGGGGSGIGGSGGWGFGSGAGKGQAAQSNDNSEQSGDAKKNGQDAESPSEQTLHIEILGDEPLRQLGIARDHRYRLGGEHGPLLTFAQVTQAVKERRQEQPMLIYLTIRLYDDSPAEDKLLVSRLKTWASDPNGGHLEVIISKANANAPRPINK